MKRWNMIHKIKALYDDGNGLSFRKISRELNISRNTVKKYIEASEDEIQIQQEQRERQKKLDPHKDYILFLLRKYPEISAEKIRQKLIKKNLNLNSSKRSIRRYVNNLKKIFATKQNRYYEPVIDMVPGVQCQVDPGEIRNVPVGNTPTTIYFVVFVLSYSRLMYTGMSLKPIDTDCFIRMHDEAFRYFDGVVEECVYDQTKLVCIQEEFREVWLNQKFHQFATAKGFELRVCEGYDPESKGRVEAGVKYVKNNFFYGEQFESPEELRTELTEWLDHIANKRNHGTTFKVPAELYEEEERRKMKRYQSSHLPREYSSYELRKVDKTSLISFKANRYSVPMEYQSSTVRIELTDNTLNILSLSGEKLASHEECLEKGKIIKNTNHYRDYMKLVSDREKDIVNITGDEIGKELCLLLKVTSPKIYKDQLLGLYRLLKKYRGRDGLSQHMKELSCRPTLKASFVKDYLEACYSKIKKLPERVVSEVEATHKKEKTNYFLKVYCALKGERPLKENGHADL